MHWKEGRGIVWRKNNIQRQYIQESKTQTLRNQIYMILHQSTFHIYVHQLISRCWLKKIDSYCGNVSASKDPGFECSGERTKDKLLLLELDVGGGGEIPPVGNNKGAFVAENIWSAENKTIRV